MRRSAQWGVLLLGLLAVAHVGSVAVPRENRLAIDFPADEVVREVRLEVTGLDGQPWSSIELHPPIPNPRRLECVLNLPPAEYRVEATYEIRPAGELDKNHGGGWTRVGVQHQIRLEGEAHHFPPPDHEAK